MKNSPCKMVNLQGSKLKGGYFMPKENKKKTKMPKYYITIRENDKVIGSYSRIRIGLLTTIIKVLEPFKTSPVQPKKVMCIETERIFKNASEAAKLLVEQRKSKCYIGAANAIKDVCKGRKKTAYGYKWKFVEE